MWFSVQSLFNLAVVLRLLPIAGVPLPLVSYGWIGADRQSVGDWGADRLRPRANRPPARCSPPAGGGQLRG